MKKQYLVVAIALVIIAGGAYAMISKQIAPAPQPLLGNDRDARGCIGSAGYSWCEAKQKCLRSWEEQCEPATNTVLSLNEAQVIAEKACLKVGDSLETGIYNATTQTWSFVIAYNLPLLDAWDTCEVSSISKTAKIEHHGSNTVPVE